ncbi:Universal stress protein [Aquisphaera giovannonii]|uniref:Universal stress protein n=1 Tax=Aquisphaera giovannonii TaxID=406548 RepID=A0A5B9WFE8_9BACT|nr:universal stress protein [Aquisphaera giovannonii]QEH38989.1 Universal stress protein [Aquisphaera giovannonii]
MSLFRKILVAADFSPGSRDAFDTACSLAGGDEARLTILHVRPELEGRGPEEGREAAIDRLREAYVPDRPLAVEYLVRDGEPRDVLIAGAAERRPDLLVMGTHGRTGLGRLVMGSVAEEVLRRAACPVLIRRSRRGDDAGRPARRPARVILHPTDFSASSDAALRVARALARDQGAKLVLLHVLQVLAAAHIDVPPTVEDPEICRQTLQSMCEALDDQDLRQSVTPQLKLGQPISEILRAAEDDRCDLLVMGTHGRTGLGRLLMGSMAEEVLRRTTCPVLLVRAGLTTPAEAEHALAGGRAGTQGAAAPRPG